MTRVVKVKPAILPKAHGSFASAVKETSRYEMKSINGQALLGYQFDGSKLFFLLNNDVVVRISIGNNAIDWSSARGTNLERLTPPENIVFEFPGGEIYPWRWEECFDSILGKKIALSPSEQFLFLSCENNREYIFNAVVSMSDESARFLYLSEV